jgi:16S rRNA (guanine966-N2)-methyltransferase
MRAFSFPSRPSKSGVGIMEITAGSALGLKLGDLPEGRGVRPTSVRARRAFFDSIGSIAGLTFADLFAGSGCMGLEAASRGAVSVVFAEESPEALELIRRNVARFEHTKTPARFQVVPGTLPASLKVRVAPPHPDIVFADPPYAKSMDMLAALTADDAFNDWTKGAVLYWELPDFQCVLRPPSGPWKLTGIRQLGAANFLQIERTDKAAR